jgi:LacI family transcriptional regulator
MATNSIKEVARRAGVSIGTVSNVLNRPDLVAPATRQRVLEAISTLGYVRNDSARQLRAGHSRTVAVVVLDVSNPFFTDVVRGAEAALDDSGSMVIVCNSDEDPARERRHLDHLEEQRVRGVLITPVDDGSNARLDLLIRHGIPVILVDRGARTRNRCSVAVDDVLGGRLAAAHLLERGHRRVAYVGGPMGIAQVADPHAGAAAVIGETPHATLQMFEMPALTTAYGRKAGEQIADATPSRRPTAVFCANDLLALGVLQEMTHRGLRVPGDIAIVGYDDIEYAGAAAVPLSSVAQPRELLGRTAAELLVGEISEGSRHRHRQVMFEPELVVRESSDSTHVTRKLY